MSSAILISSYLTTSNIEHQTAALQPASSWGDAAPRAIMKAARSDLTPESANAGPSIHQSLRTPV